MNTFEDLDSLIIKVSDIAFIQSTDHIIKVTSKNSTVGQFLFKSQMISLGECPVSSWNTQLMNCIGVINYAHVKKVSH